MGRARGPGAPLPRGPAGDRDLLRGLGAQRPGGARRRRLQLLGRPRPPDALAGLVRGVGAVRPRAWPRAPGTSTPSRRRTAVARTKADPLAGPRQSGRRPPRRWWPTSPLRLGRRGVDGRPAPDGRPLPRADEHLRGAPGLVAARACPTGSSPSSWPQYVDRHGLHPRGVPAGGRAPLRRLVGLPGHLATTRPTARFGSPGRLPPPGRRAAPARASASCVDWVPAPLPARRVGAGPLRRHRRCTSTPTRAAASTRTGARSSSTSAATRCATSSSPTRSTGWRSSTSTACGSTRSPPCSTSTTPASPASGCPNEYGGRENLEAIAFLQEANATVLQAHPGRHHRSPRSPPSWPGVSRPTYLGGLGFGFKWNMGWMHDTLDYMSRDPIYRQYHHNELTFAMLYAWQRELRPAAVPRRGRARQGLAARQDARRPLAAARQPAGAATPTCGPTRARSCCSWAASSPRSAEWSDERGLDWWMLDYGPTTRRCSALVARPQCRLPGAARAVAAGPRPGRLRAGSTPTIAGNVRRSPVPAPRHRPGAGWPASPTSPPCPTTVYRLGLPVAGRWPR